MRERNWNLTQGHVEEAKDRYQKLLNHYKIDQVVQDAVWVTVLKDFEDNPRKVVREIQDYWETAFGANERGSINSKHCSKHSKDKAHYDSDSNHESEKSDAELSLNKRRQNWRNESFEISREGNKTKARKKAKKRNKRKKYTSR